MLEYFTINNSIWITKWKSKGLSKESFEVISTSNNSLFQSINHYRDKVRLKFKGSILQQKAIKYNHGKVVNLYVVYEIINFKYNNSPILTNATFGAIKITKNADIKKYRYSGYGIGFDSQIFFNRPSGRISRRNNFWSRYELINQYC